MVLPISLDIFQVRNNKRLISFRIRKKYKNEARTDCSFSLPTKMQMQFAAIRLQKESYILSQTTYRIS